MMKRWKLYTHTQHAIKYCNIYSANYIELHTHVYCRVDYSIIIIIKTHFYITVLSVCGD